MPLSTLITDIETEDITQRRISLAFELALNPDVYYVLSDIMRGIIPVSGTESEQEMQDMGKVDTSQDGKTFSSSASESQLGNSFIDKELLFHVASQNNLLSTRAPF